MCKSYYFDPKKSTNYFGLLAQMKFDASCLRVRPLASVSRRSSLLRHPILPHFRNHRARNNYIGFYSRPQIETSVSWKTTRDFLIQLWITSTVWHRVSKDEIWMLYRYHYVWQWSTEIWQAYLFDISLSIPSNIGSKIKIQKFFLYLRTRWNTTFGWRELSVVKLLTSKMW